ncbi:MAG TPA: hypothetical protein VHT00_14135 [Stellaceae bacterium]|jgi:hypothetical protein|nr:hypothetical protein [Stellaceae bacterium]
MSETLKQFAERAAEGAARIFDALGEMPAMYHAVDRHGRDLLIGEPPAEDRDVAVDLVRELLAHIGATRVAFLNEAWTVRGMTKPEADAIVGKVADHPDRMEVLVITAEDVREPALFGHRRIIRHDKSTELGPLQWFDMNNAQGRMIGLLPPPPGQRLS